MQDKTDIIQKFIEMQETDYKNTLALLGIIELLIEKNIITVAELSKKTSCIHELANLPTPTEGALNATFDQQISHR